MLSLAEDGAPRRPLRRHSVVLVGLRLRRDSGLAALAVPGTTWALTGSIHVLAAVHSAIAVGISAATALRTMAHLAVIHGRLAGLSRSAGRLVLHRGCGSAGLGRHLVSLMGLRGLRSDRAHEGKGRRSGKKNIVHVMISRNR